MTPASEVQALAEAWFARQMELSRARLGAHWTAHCEWVAEYWREIVRQRLVARGWRAP